MSACDNGPDFEREIEMQRGARCTAFGLMLLGCCVTAVGQDARATERPIPPLQFGSTGSFNGFQFQQATFGPAVAAPIAFEGIQFPGFGSLYDVQRQDQPLQPRDDAALFVPRGVSEPFTGRFASSRFATDRRSREFWRMNRSDPFGYNAGGPTTAASRDSVARDRRPFGSSSPAVTVPSWETFVPSRPVQRIASEADVRGGRRRPFLD